MPITLLQDTSTEAKDSAKTDAQDENEDKKTLGLTNTRSTLEERRKSLLDHHWAIPSKDRLVLNEFDSVIFIIILVFNIFGSKSKTLLLIICVQHFFVFLFSYMKPQRYLCLLLQNIHFCNLCSVFALNMPTYTHTLTHTPVTAPYQTISNRTRQILSYCLSNSRRSSEDEADNESNITVDSGARVQEPQSTSSLAGSAAAGATAGGAGAAAAAIAAASASTSGAAAGLMPGGILPPSAIDLEHLEQLSKQSCYDSGIDIREPIPTIQPIPKKTVYSDADIVLSSDWVPPKTIVPTHFSESPPRSTILGGQSLDAPGGPRKKTSSVSFSVDDEAAQQAQAAAAVAAAQGDKQAEKKSKVSPAT